VPFAGEDIGKAMETGLLAADGLHECGADTAVGQQHEPTLRALSPEFRLFEAAGRVDRRP
jgi:hypothetical protein